MTKASGLIDVFRSACGHDKQCVARGRGDHSIKRRMIGSYAGPGVREKANDIAGYGNLACCRPCGGCTNEKHWMQDVIK